MTPFRYPREAIRARRREGLQIKAIAAEFGCSAGTVKVACKGIVCPVDHQRAAAERNVQRAIKARSENARAARRAAGLPPPNPKHDPVVPGWARAAGLAADYRDFKNAFGEHYAARVCRRLAAEARLS
jgi:hypothetical protein